ncbi:hypothetical protein NDU88_012597 [Pleurodeles waltl]|uniref:Uncharacterized protein n=1 Tax=Pleurodeles waltl TaxID=8319 RepID=A0AAV7R4A0_PLEWA|nr:hypothetical protein NDU88_012597 [Pleurodeles waltl]
MEPAYCEGLGAGEGTSWAAGEKCPHLNKEEGALSEMQNARPMALEFFVSLRSTGIFSVEVPKCLVVHHTLERKALENKTLKEKNGDTKNIGRVQLRSRYTTPTPTAGRLDTRERAEDAPQTGNRSPFVFPPVFPPVSEGTRRPEFLVPSLRGADEAAETPRRSVQIVDCPAGRGRGCV